MLTWRQLGWSRPHGASILAAQLCELGKACGGEVRDMAVAQALARAVPQIYAALTDLRLTETGEIEVVKAILEVRRVRGWYEHR